MPAEYTPQPETTQQDTDLRDTVARLEERLTGMEALLRLQIDHQKERTENRHRQIAEFRDLVRGLDERVRDVERGMTRRGLN